jgi:hypothetical protein
MFALMLGSWFKNMQLVTSYVGCDFAIVVVTKNDEQLLSPLSIEEKNW